MKIISIFFLYFGISLITPAVCDTYKSIQKCPPNEEYLECGPACQTECPTLGEPCNILYKKCPSGCYCKKGFARKTKGGRCVPINQCPPKNTTCDMESRSEECPMCPPNEEYLECGPACQTECPTLGEPCPIRYIKCPSGCYCKKGFARKTKGGRCVPINQCPPKNTKCDMESRSEECPKCPPNEEYLKCGPACQTECPTLGEPCPIRYIKCPSGCYCKKGYARITKGGRCVPIDHCPPKWSYKCDTKSSTEEGYSKEFVEYYKLFLFCQ